MFRFVMPDIRLPNDVQIRLLRSQFDAFLYSDALGSLFDLLQVDQGTFSRLYNGRQRSDGSSREIQELEPIASLERHREKLYPLLEELGFLTINKPLEPDHSHLVVLGGSLESCFTRTRRAAVWMTPSVRYVDGLACYRPIHPKERKGKTLFSNCETEFGAISDSFTSVFALPSVWEDTFHGDENLNSICCIRRFSGLADNRRYQVFAAPSSQPEKRRADTGDSYRFYLEHTELHPSDSLLILTDNCYCNRQFLQLAFLMLKQKCPARFDMIGCTSDENIISCERYDPAFFLQEVVSILNWIERFKREL